MASICLQNGSAVIGTGIVESATISVSDGMISAFEARDGEVVDCTGLTLLPGFIDVHIHGAVGIDVNVAGTDGLIEIARFLAMHGVTAWVPTLVPDTDENYARTISAIDGLMEVQSREPIAQAVGIHYEGVFANEKMCGALRPEYFKKYTGGQVGGLPRLKQGVHMTTFAPEIDGGIELARELVQRGWIASIGHTRADVETLDAALAAGARHVTHFFNAMTGMHHRDLGVAGWTMANADVTFDIIADGVHVHPKMLEFACRAKTPDRVSLISDSVAPTGLGDGEFTIWGEKVTVQNLRTQNERGSIAGSVITMHDAARRMNELGFSWPDVSMMASRNPARLLGIESTHGAIEIGKRADLLGIDAEGNIGLTVIGGMVLRP